MRLISRSLAVLALATGAIVGVLAGPANAAPASTHTGPYEVHIGHRGDRRPAREAARIDALFVPELLTC